MHMKKLGVALLLHPFSIFVILESSAGAHHIVNHWFLLSEQSKSLINLPYSSLGVYFSGLVISKAVSELPG